MGLAGLEPLARAEEREKQEMRQCLIEPIQLLEWTGDSGDQITREDAIAIQVTAYPGYANVGERMQMNQFGIKVASVALDSMPPTRETG